MSTEGYSCLVPASNAFCTPDLSTELRVLCFFSCSNHTKGRYDVARDGDPSLLWMEGTELRNSPPEDQEA